VLINCSTISLATNAMPTPRLPINQRFALLSKAVQMVAAGGAPSLIVVGPPGLGKSYAVVRTLEVMGLLRDADFFVIKGFSSARALYEKLYEHNGRLTIVDDCDHALSDATAIALLKGALDSDRVRTLSWLTAAKTADLFPKTFEFHGQMIFISNLAMHEINGPVRTRSLLMNLEMTRGEILERMETILPRLEIPHLRLQPTPNQRRAAMDFIQELAPSIPELNLRTLCAVLRIILAHPSDWKPLATYFVTQG